MPKKFFDIIPPEEKELKSERVDFYKNDEEIKLEVKFSSPISSKEEKDLHSRKDKDVRISNNKNKKKKMFLNKFLLKTAIVFVFLFIIVSISGYFLFSKIEIEITPKTEVLTFKERIIIDKNAKQIDFPARIIPGKIFEDQRSASSEFLSQGRTLKEERARGVIRVYNNYSDTPQTLIANTRFVSSDGKLFRSVKQEVIPGGKYENGKLNPGFADVEVYAAESGEDYNIGPSTFSIPGFVGTPKYTAFYGKSLKPMTGGFKGEVPVVSQNDLENAKNILFNRLKEESISFLKKNIPQDFILLDNAISYEIIKENSSVEKDKEAKSFNFQLEIKFKGVAFRKSDVNNFIKNIVDLNTGKDKSIREENIKTSFSFNSKQDDRIILDMEVKAMVYPKIDLLEVKKGLVGKSVQEIDNLSDNFLIEKIKIKRFPILINKVPNDINRIEVIFNFPEFSSQ